MDHIARVRNPGKGERHSRNKPHTAVLGKAVGFPASFGAKHPLGQGVHHLQAPQGNTHARVPVREGSVSPDLDQTRIHAEVPRRGVSLAQNNAVRREREDDRALQVAQGPDYPQPVQSGRAVDSALGAATLLRQGLSDGRAVRLGLLRSVRQDSGNGKGRTHRRGGVWNHR